MFRLIVFIVLLHLTILNIHAMTKNHLDSLSVVVYYPCGSSNVSNIPGNIPSLHSFIHQLDSLCQSPFTTPASLFVTSSTSPEGSLLINKILAHKRNMSVIDYLNNNSERFRSISSSRQCKYHEQVTNDKLGKIHSSSYPSMRYSRVTLFLNNIEKEDSAEVYVEEQPVAAVVEETPMTTNSLVTHDTAASIATKSFPLFWVKTNLLYDLLTFVNASMEIPLTKNITAEATLVYPWWRNTSRHKTIQMCYVAVTPRYYFNNADRSYTSLFAGLTVGGGKYDLQWTHRGVQGSMWHVSPVIGYSHHISKRWKMEYSASVGFVHTKYQKYTQTSDTPYGEIKVKDYPWVSKVLNTVLPTSLNVSIVYTFTKSKQIGRHEE